MKIYNRVIVKIIAFMMMAAVLVFAPAGRMNVSAAGTFNTSYFTSGHTGTDAIDDSDRQAAYNYLITYMNNLITVNKPSQDIKDRLGEVWSGANSYIASNNYTASGLVDYVCQQHHKRKTQEENDVYFHLEFVTVVFNHVEDFRPVRIVSDGNVIAFRKITLFHIPGIRSLNRA